MTALLLAAPLVLIILAGGATPVACQRYWSEVKRCQLGTNCDGPRLDLTRRHGPTGSRPCAGQEAGRRTGRAPSEGSAPGAPEGRDPFRRRGLARPEG